MSKHRFHVGPDARFNLGYVVVEAAKDGSGCIPSRLVHHPYLSVGRGLAQQVCDRLNEVDEPLDRPPAPRTGSNVGLQPLPRNVPEELVIAEPCEVHWKDEDEDDDGIPIGPAWIVDATGKTFHLDGWCGKPEAIRHARAAAWNFIDH